MTRIEAIIGQTGSTGENETEVALLVNAALLVLAARSPVVGTDRVFGSRFGLRASSSSGAIEAAVDSIYQLRT